MSDEKQEPLTGLGAALADRQWAADDAQARDDADGAEAGASGHDAGPEPISSSNEWRSGVELVLGIIDGWMKSWAPGWEPPAGGSREAGVQAWCTYLATVAAAPTPLQQALAFTAINYGPPLIVGWKVRRARRAEGEPDAQDDPRG